MPIRLLEIGASAGLNLSPERNAYVSGGRVFGDPASPVCFDEPWTPALSPALAGAAERLVIADRAGCDPNPLDPADREDRLTLESYCWPDELARLERHRAAIAIAAASPVRLARVGAEEWLPGQLATRAAGQLTVVWHSVMRQYVPADAWDTVQAVIADARQDAGGPVAVVSMEPIDYDGSTLFVTTADGENHLLATCTDHGPPVKLVAEGASRPSAVVDPNARRRE